MTLGVVGDEDGEVGRACIMEGLVCNVTHIREAHEKKPEKYPLFCKKGVISDINKRTSAK